MMQHSILKEKVDSNRDEQMNVEQFINLDSIYIVLAYLSATIYLQWQIYFPDQCKR